MSDLAKNDDNSSPKPQFNSSSTRSCTANEAESDNPEGSASSFHSQTNLTNSAGRGISPPVSVEQRVKPPYSGNSPMSTPPLAPRSTIVPLITPRYQKKTRSKQYIEVTDSAEDRLGAAEALMECVKETMKIQSGKAKYEQDIVFQTYDLFRHGKHQVLRRSVGYSSDGDLVMTREDISDYSDIEKGFNRIKTEVFNPICLDPQARRPLTDVEEEHRSELRLKAPKYKKYPGIRAPKNRKTRNRLLNDYFASEQAKILRAKNAEFLESEHEDDELCLRPSFLSLPEACRNALIDITEEEQQKEFEKMGVSLQSGSKSSSTRHPDSGEARFSGLNTRLRGDLQHAADSVFLSKQMEDLEVQFSRLAQSDGQYSLVYHFLDGYGRLVCHGVAAYYLLISESSQLSDGTKITMVSLPRTKKRGIRKVNLPLVPLLQVLRKNRCNFPAKHALSPPLRPMQPPEANPNLSLSSRTEFQESPMPMSPLRLDGTPNASSSTSPVSRPQNTLVFPNSELESAPLGNLDTRRYKQNTTVIFCPSGKSITQLDIPIYEPQLTFADLSEEVFAAWRTCNSQQRGPDEDLVGTKDSPFAENTPPLSATQRRKIRRAARGNPD